MREGLAWLRRWGISLASLAGGVLTLFVFRRELPHVALLVGYLLLLWLVFAALSRLRPLLDARGHRWLIRAADYAVQTLHHGLLLFVLPAYWASATLRSANAVFLALLVVLALLATFDPWYAAVVSPRRWLGAALLVVSSFAGLNVALPLVGMPPFAALLVSAAAAAALLGLSLPWPPAWPWRWAAYATLVLAVVASGLAALGRGLVPPAPLALAEATLARDVVDLEPVAPLAGAIRATALRGGLVAFTAVYAPAGLDQPIAHVWRFGNRVAGVVQLSPVHGGRRAGFRTFSRKTGFPADPVGPWSVDVMTSSGQLIGRLSFRVTP